MRARVPQRVTGSRPERRHGKVIHEALRDGGYLDRREAAPGRGAGGGGAHRHGPTGSTPTPEAAAPRCPSPSGSLAAGGGSPPGRIGASLRGLDDDGGASHRPDPGAEVAGHHRDRIASATNATGTDPQASRASWKRPSSKPGRRASSRRSR